MCRVRGFRGMRISLVWIIWCVSWRFWGILIRSSGVFMWRGLTERGLCVICLRRLLLQLAVRQVFILPLIFLISGSECG